MIDRELARNVNKAYQDTRSLKATGLMLSMSQSKIRKILIDVGYYAPSPYYTAGPCFKFK